jgi:hypothetical protein
LRYGRSASSPRGFSCQRGLGHFASACARARIRISALMGIRICQDPPPTCLTRAAPVGLPFCVSPWLITAAERGRNVDRLSIGYAFRPHLRSRLTLRGRTFRKNPWPYGGQDSHLSFRYSCRQSHFRLVQQSSRSAFTYYGTLPYCPARDDTRARPAASVDGLSPVGSSAQHHSTSELLRTL